MPAYSAGLLTGNFDSKEGDADAVLCCSAPSANGILTTAENFMSRGLMDIGGDEDVLGQRLDMSLPYPGVLMKAKVPEDGSLFGLVAPLRRSKAKRSGWASGGGGGGMRGEDTRELLREHSNGSVLTNSGAGVTGGAGDDTFAGLSGDADGLAGYTEFMRRVIVSARAVAKRESRRRSKQRRQRDVARETSTIEFSFASSPADSYSRSKASPGMYGFTPNGGPRGLELPPAAGFPPSSAASGSGSGRGAGRGSRNNDAPVFARGGGGADSYSDASSNRSDDDSYDRSSSDSDSASDSSSSGSSDSSGSSGGRRSHKSRGRQQKQRSKLTDVLQPASQNMLWLAGISLLSLFAGSRTASNGGRCGRFTLCCSRASFACGRLLRRTALPLPPNRTAMFYAATVLHTLLLMFEVSLTIMCVAVLWCIEPSSDIGGPALKEGDTAAAYAYGGVPDILVIGECSYTALLIYLAAPPLTCILPSLLGLVALATQSSRELRVYAEWNGYSIWSTLVALTVLVINVQQVGASTLSIPFGLLAAKLLSAQLVPVQLASLETARPVRGWRGLFEVRTGPIERARKSEKEQ